MDGSVGNANGRAIQYRLQTRGIGIGHACADHGAAAAQALGIDVGFVLADACLGIKCADRRHPWRARLRSAVTAIWVVGAPSAE